MKPDLIFGLANQLALAGWLVLVLLPRWRWSARLICPVIITGIIGIAYAVLIIRFFGSSDGGFGSLEGVAALFQSKHLLLAGWLHYLAFDLFIGSWEIRDSQRNNIHHLMVVPCLLLTFLFGPVGLLCYLLLRGIRTRRPWLEISNA